MVAHQPVMAAEVIRCLAPERGGVFVDCTVGAAGHSRALLEGGATRLLAIDRDPSALTIAREALSAWASRVEFVHADFKTLGRILDARDLAEVDGVLADLGVSSMQLDAPGRGFSFRRDEPLDMRMDPTEGPTAAELLAVADERTLADVIYQYGEERFARRIARAIVATRERQPIGTTGELASLVRRVVGRRGGRIDPATRTFQALRIWVNRELEGLDALLREAVDRLRTGGRLAVVAFHSLEDRVVKHTFRALASGGAPLVRLLTKRPIVPDEAEVSANPRARSARLRAVERLG
jgi:16S rRNA (cytosine1402-N4)-methyltransferase